MNNYSKNTSLHELFRRFLSAGLVLFLFSGNLFAASMNLAWDVSTSSDVGGYKLSYGKTSGNYTSSVDVGNKTTYTMSGLEEGTKYYFAVKAYDSNRTTESGYSNEINIAVPVTEALAADFTASATSGAPGLAVDFTPTTSGTITSWKWDLPGSYTPTVTNSTAKVVTATYPTAGTYSVSLTVTGSSGSITKTKSNLITVTSTSTGGTDGGTTTGGTTGGTDGGTTTGGTDGGTTTGTGISNDGLVAAFGFEEINGDTVVDTSGNGNHGTIKEAVSITAGRYGKALKFDGVNDWVTVNDSASLDLSTGLTLEAWVYPQSLTTGGKTVIFKEQDGGAVYNLYANEDANLPISSFNDGSYRVISGTNQLPINEWTHLVATYDGQYQRLYVNGVEVAKSPQNGLIQPSSGALRIGGNSAWGEYFQGYIDEVRIYNRALTEMEVNNNLAGTTDTGTTDTGTTSVSNQQHFIMGNMNEEPWVEYRPQGTAQAFQTVPEKSGVVTEVQAYLDASTTATELVAGIYKDNNGHPGTLIAKGTSSTVKPGAWNSVAIAEASVTAGQPYWIAILGPNGEIGFLDQVGSGTGVMEKSYSRRALTNLPDTWNGSRRDYKTNASMSIYGNGY